jgi:hypothetical protein
MLHFLSICKIIYRDLKIMVVTLSFGYFVPDPTTNYYYLDLVVTIKSKNIDPPNVDTENWRFHPKWIF